MSVHQFKSKDDKLLEEFAATHSEDFVSEFETVFLIMANKIEPRRVKRLMQTYRDMRLAYLGLDHMNDAGEIDGEMYEQMNEFARVAHHRFNRAMSTFFGRKITVDRPGYLQKIGIPYAEHE